MAAAALASLTALPAAATTHPAETTPTAVATAGGAVISNVPAAVRIGAPHQSIAVVVRSAFPGHYAAAKLVDPRTGPRFGGALSSLSTRWALPVPITASNVNRYGAWLWQVAVYDTTNQPHTAFYPATVKANSLLGLAGSSAGEPTVKLTAAVRAWNNAIGRYQGWPGVGVFIQKQAPNGGWVNVGAATSDRYGNITKTLTSRSGVYRIYDHDTATAWGATSVPVRITAPTRPAPPPNPGDTVNCPDFHRWADAQAWYKKYYPYYGDVARLDADHDGIACESLPGAP